MNQLKKKCLNAPVLICLILLSLTVTVYLPTSQYNFVNFDDYKFVRNNPHLQEGLTREGVRWMFSSGWGQADPNVDYWRPLSFISHALDVELFGMNPGAHHATNVLLHALTAIALFWAIRNLTGCTWRSALVAALFSLHPLRVESVAWITERKDILSGLFCFLSIGAYATYSRERFSVRAYMPFFMFYIMALMSKPMSVTLPCLLLLLDFWPLNRLLDPVESNRFKRLNRRVLYEKIPLFLLSGIIVIATIATQISVGTVRDNLSFGVRLGNFISSTLIYIRQAFWPTGLAVFYPPKTPNQAFVIIGACALILLSLLAFLNVRKRPYLMAGWLWYLGMLFPVSGLLMQAGAQAHADRYTYIPQVGLLLMLIWSLAELVEKSRKYKVIAVVLSAFVLTLLSGLSHRQVKHWENSKTLWAHALKTTGPDQLSFGNLGQAYAEEGDYETAVYYLNRSLEENPTGTLSLAGMAAALSAQGKTDEAIHYYQKAIDTGMAPPEAYNNLARLYIWKEHYADALTVLQKTIDEYPHLAESHFLLSEVLWRQGKPLESLHYAELAIQQGLPEALSTQLLQRFSGYFESVKEEMRTKRKSKSNVETTTDPSRSEGNEP